MLSICVTGLRRTVPLTCGNPDGGVQYHRPANAGKMSGVERVMYMDNIRTQALTETIGKEHK